MEWNMENKAMYILTVAIVYILQLQFAELFCVFPIVLFHSMKQPLLFISGCNGLVELPWALVQVMSN